jgi:hypothetical protein
MVNECGLIRDAGMKVGSGQGRVRLDDLGNDCIRRLGFNVRGVSGIEKLTRLL